MTSVLPMPLAAPAHANSPAPSPALRIDLGAVAANYRAVRQRYHGRALSAVVKSDAYGLGIEQIVATLRDAGCRDYWVNDLDEAVRVRAVAPDSTIYALMGLAGHEARDFEAAGAIPALASLEEIEHCARHALLSQRRLSVAIQLDTGLGRLGLCEEELGLLAAQPDILAMLDLRLWVSHLAAYNLPDSAANAEQRNKLRAWTSRLPPAPISLAASSGVYMERDWHFDVARVGSALYGVQTSTRWQDGLRPCYELSAGLLKVAHYPAGRCLGYRGLSELARPSRIATLAIGYANGLPQRFAQAGFARLEDKLAPLVGGLAMNMTMIDITDLPDGSPQADSRAILLDAQLPVELHAERLGCAPNVLLTQIGAGTRKDYIDP